MRRHRAAAASLGAFWWGPSFLGRGCPSLKKNDARRFEAAPSSIWPLVVARKLSLIPRFSRVDMFDRDKISVSIARPL